jgi:hypothetical protein
MLRRGYTQGGSMALWRFQYDDTTITSVVGIVNNILYSSIFFIGVDVDMNGNGCLWSGILVMAQ